MNLFNEDWVKSLPAENIQKKPRLRRFRRIEKNNKKTILWVPGILVPDRYDVPCD